MLKLERQVGTPRVAETRIQRYCSIKPFARFGILTITPEKLGDGDDDMSIVFALLQRVHTFCVLALLWFKLHRLGPEDSTRWALLKSLAHQVVRKTLATIQHLHLDTLKPQHVCTWIPQTGLLQKRPSFRILLLTNLTLHGAHPQRHAPWALLQTSFEELGGLDQLWRRLLHVDLTTDHPHLCECRVLLK